jgi:preprotein translocase subunit SecG
VATTESRPWWTPIIISLFGFIITMTNLWYYLPPWLLNTANLLIGLFLILLILIQRGKGGGLAGAFGGVGGSSPFGSRAGDVFTRYTITVATLWLWICLIQVKVIRERSVERPAPGSQGQSGVVLPHGRDALACRRDGPASDGGLLYQELASHGWPGLSPRSPGMARRGFEDSAPATQPSVSGC